MIIILVGLVSGHVVVGCIERDIGVSARHLHTHSTRRRRRSGPQDGGGEVVVEAILS